MKYKCLVFDHDDTTVNSTAGVHYPSFVEFMKLTGHEHHYSLEDYVRYNFDPGVVDFFEKMCGLSPEELEYEQEFWANYAKAHRSAAFPGIREVMAQQKKNGGFIAVVSHSMAENILRDFEYNQLPAPDMIFGWEQPEGERKPSPAPLYKIMNTYHLSPGELLVIDDLKPGLDMARRAGVPFAAAGWGFSIPENERYMREHADFYCKSVTELATLL